MCLTSNRYRKTGSNYERAKKESVEYKQTEHLIEVIVGGARCMRQGAFLKISFEPQLIKSQTWPIDRYRQEQEFSGIF